MKTLIGCLSVLLLASGCKKDEALTPESNATIMLTAEAGVFMTILKDKGGIPEITADRHGNLQSGMMCNPSPEAEFPFSAQFRAVMSDAATTTYGFVVTKAGASSPWAMTKAWRQSNGVTMDLTLPPTAVQAAANAELQRRKEAE